jgi:hypothetical protein
VALEGLSAMGREGKRDSDQGTVNLIADLFHRI